MTKKQFEKHACNPEHKASKTLFASQIIDLTCKGENQKLLVTGYDGIEYLIKIQKPIAIPLIKPADEILQHKRNAKDFTEPLNRH